ncbi:MULTISPECIES: PIN domain-containing protein [Sphingobacterium]|uniref:PIN domain-containing protein n=1 Tax=Sphingobacterium TaxID=28453 RepID=UPI00257F9815|nr:MULTISPECIES: hypothetical protein [Sphingobacterium]
MIESVFLTILGVPFVTDLIKGIAKQGYKKLKDSNEVLKFLAEYDIEEPKDENRSLYIHTLIRFQALVGNSSYFNILITEDAFKIFENSYIISKDKEPFINHVDSEITAQITDYEHGIQQNLHRKVLEQFFLTYDALLRSVATPFENSIITSIEELSKTQQSANKAIIEKLDSINDDSPLIKSQIDFFNEYLNDRKFKEGLKALENLESHVQTIKKPEFRSTLFINIGYCHFELGNKEVASKYFKKAYEENNENFAALCNYSQTLVHTNEIEMAESLIKQAVKLYGDNNSEVWEGYILVMRKKYKVASFIKDIPEKFINKASIQRVLGIAYRTEGDFENYFNSIHSAYALNSELGDVKIAFIESEILRYQTDYRIFNLRSISSTLKVQIEDYIKMVDSMIDAESDATDAKLFLIQAKSIFLYILRKETEALNFLTGIESEFDLGRQKIYRLKSMLLLMNHKFEDAFILIEKYVGLFNDGDDIMMQFEIANHLNLNESMERSFAKIKNLQDQIHLYQAMYIYTIRYTKHNDRENLKNLLLEIKSIHGIEFRFLEARVLFYLNDPEFENVLNSYGNQLGSQIRLSVVHDLIDLYEKAEKWENAIQVMEKRFELDDYEPLTDRYITNLYQSGNHAKLQEKFEKLRTSKGVHENYTLKECNIYVDNYQHLKAISIAKDYIKEFSERLDVELFIVTTQFRIGDLESVDTFLSREINTEKLGETDFNNYLVLLALRGKSTKCLNILYDYHRKHNSAHSNDLYLSFWLKYGFSEQIDIPQKVQANTVVVISDGEHENRILVITDPELYEPISSKHEISLKDDLVIKMLNKEVGYHFEMDDIFVQKDWIVKSIENKFVYQFNKCREDAAGVFKREAAVKSFHIDDLLKMMATGSTKTKEDPFKDAFAVYENGQCGLGMLSEAWQEDPLNIRDQIIARKLHIMTSFGTIEEQTIKFDLNENKILVLDVTAIITLSNLELLELVCQHYNHLLISQSSYEIIYERFMQKSFGTERLKTEQDPLLKLLKDHFEIKNPNTLSINQGDKDKLYRTFGRSIYDSALLAQENNATLYSDDLFARVGCSKNLSLESCWTIPILKYLKDKQFLEEGVYQAKSLKLLDLNYKFVDINYQTMFYWFEKNNYKISENFIKVIGQLSGNISSYSSAISTFINFIDQLLNVKQLKNQDILDISSFILSYLSIGRDLNLIKYEYEEIVFNKQRSLQYTHFMKILFGNFRAQYY